MSLESITRASRWTKLQPDLLLKKIDRMYGFVEKKLGRVERHLQELQSTREAVLNGGTFSAAEKADACEQLRGLVAYLEKLRIDNVDLIEYVLANASIPRR